MGSFLRRLAYLVSSRTLFWLALITCLTFLAGSWSPHLLWRLAWVPCSFLWVSVKLLLQYRVRGKVQAASEVLEEMGRTRGEYALLLRPFGADGFIHVETGLTAKGKEKKRRWRETTTVEVVLAEAVKDFLDVPTFAVVSPDQVILAPGPRYVRATEDNWKSDVDGLLRRALFVVVIFSPGKGCTPAVRWEIERCVRLGLIGRLLLLTPPREMDGSDASRQALRGVRDLFAGLAQAPPETLCAFPSVTGTVRYWRTQRSATGKHAVAVQTYSAILKDVLASVRATCAKLSFAGRYPYLDVDDA